MPYYSVDELDFSLAGLPVLERPGRVLLTTPHHYEVAYVINPHMKGHIGTVDSRDAMQQWVALGDAYRGLGFEVSTLNDVDGLPDMVFCANQTLPFLARDGSCGVVLSRMYAPQRRDEVAHYERFFQKAGYTVRQLPASTGAFEGMGDALWHPGRRLLWGGYGYRTTSNAYDALAELLDVPILALELTDAAFYHLDTCLCVLDEHTALVYPPAFTPESLALINHFFEHILEVPDQEARDLFACNAHCPDGKHVLIQRGCAVTNDLLRSSDFVPVEIETGEFLKAGGSVFCMKLAYW